MADIKDTSLSKKTIDRQILMQKSRVYKVPTLTKFVLRLNVGASTYGRKFVGIVFSWRKG